MMSIRQMVRLRLWRGGTITASDVESLTDADGNDITLRSTGGGIEVGLINAGTTQGDIILDAQGGTINR